MCCSEFFFKSEVGGRLARLAKSIQWTNKFIKSSSVQHTCMLDTRNLHTCTVPYEARLQIWLWQLVWCSIIFVLGDKSNAFGPIQPLMKQGMVCEQSPFMECESCPQDALALPLFISRTTLGKEEPIFRLSFWKRRKRGRKVTPCVTN